MDKIAVTPFAGVWIEIEDIENMLKEALVTPFAGVWIEIQITQKKRNMCHVTPFAGVWIEIAIRTIFDSKCCRSLPSRECGLKYLSYLLCFILWPSLPSRECGLKSVPFVLLLSPFVVTPFAGVWIEITWVPNL